MCHGNIAETDDIYKGRDNSTDKVWKFILEYSKENIAVVKLFIQEPYYTNIKKDVAITSISFLGNSGGLIGLFMGFSLVSAVEWVYHLFNFVIKVFERMCPNPIKLNKT